MLQIKEHYKYSYQAVNTFFFFFFKKSVFFSDGNIIPYIYFIHSFYYMIESKSDSDHDRLHFLIQYLKGQAQDLVKTVSTEALK